MGTTTSSAKVGCLIGENKTTKLQAIATAKPDSPARSQGLLEPTEERQVVLEASRSWEPNDPDIHATTCRTMEQQI